MRKILVFVFLLILSAFPSTAGNVILSNNSGSGNSVWEIQGEPSLIMTGWNLDTEGIARPTSIDRVSISIVTPVPGQAVQVVIYQDANGGSPSDAALLRQERAEITTAGVFTHTFATPVQISEAVVWVGFYLPVGTEFRGDTSGSSVLTYWAWQPGTTFSLANLGSASVLGPADGSAPVNLDMNGVARITAEVITDSTPTRTTTPVPATTITNTRTTSSTENERILQVVSSKSVTFTPMFAYPGCQSVAYDTEEIAEFYNYEIRVECKTETDTYAPTSPAGYTRSGSVLYDITVFGEDANLGSTVPLPEPVTHCIVPTPRELESGVIGVATGAPRAWRILPTVRFGQILCAEVARTGYLAVFFPN